MSGEANPTGDRQSAVPIVQVTIYASFGEDDGLLVSGWTSCSRHPDLEGPDLERFVADQLESFAGRMRDGTLLALDVPS